MRFRVCLCLLTAAAAAAPCERAGTLLPAEVGQEKRADYETVKRKARAWLDALEVDPVELLRHGVKGKKKLAEILDSYLSLLRHAKDPRDTASIRRRVAELARQAERPEYHDMARLNDVEFTQNSMSYLRVAWLLDRLAINIAGYREEILKVKPRLDQHLAARGPWQQAMFLEYYDRLGLEKPPRLSPDPMKGGVISRRVPASLYDENTTYDLTHEVFVAYDYGNLRRQTRFSPEDLAYTREVLPRLARRFMAARNPDLVGELLSCMTYLGWHDDPAYRAALDYLLASQNANGTWGDYEKHRSSFGKYLDQHVYLHTTMVVLGSLLEAQEGGWPRSPAPPAVEKGGVRAAGPRVGAGEER